MPKSQPKYKSHSVRVEQKRKRNRQEILSTAQEVLIEQGVEGVTLASVAGKLNLTKQALYHYFPAKDVLLKSLVTSLLNDEVNALITAVSDPGVKTGVLGTMIRAFYAYYIDRLEVFRFIYCQSQLNTESIIKFDEVMLRDEVNPATRRLFDILEDRLCTELMIPKQRAQIRRLAFSAWLSALGLLNMLGVADASRDPLIHSDKDLLDTLVKVFDDAVAA